MIFGHADDMIPKKCLELFFVYFRKGFKFNAAAFANEAPGRRPRFSGRTQPPVVDNFARQPGQVEFGPAHKDVHRRIHQPGVIIGQVFQGQSADADVDQPPDMRKSGADRSVCGVLRLKAGILAPFRSHRVGPHHRLLRGSGSSGYIACLRSRRRGG